MKGKYLRRIGAIILAMLVLPSVVVLSSETSAQTQRRLGQGQRRVVVVRPHRPIYRRFYNPWFRPWGYDPYFDHYSRYSHYVFKSSESAFNQGHKDGVKTGTGDAKNRRTYKPERSHYFQEAGFGNFGEVYRQGFVQGYADGYRS